MSQTADQMELREEDIRKHYAAATALLTGFDHTPRIASGNGPEEAEERWCWCFMAGAATRTSFSTIRW